MKEKGTKRKDKRKIKRNDKYKIKVANGGIMHTRLRELSISTYEERGIKYFFWKTRGFRPKYRPPVVNLLSNDIGMKESLLILGYFLARLDKRRIL